MQFSKTLICFLFLFQGLAFSWNISSESLLKKLEKEPPEWIKSRIQKDLAYFEQGLSSDKIDLCLQNLYEMEGSKNKDLVRICFKEGIESLSPLYPLNPKQQIYVEEFLSALKLLDSISPIPDLDFVLCTSSSFDRPILLMNTTVPIFAVSKEKHNKKVALIPRLWDGKRENSLQTLSYDWNKKIEKAFWRGDNNDGYYGHYYWDCQPRAILALLSRHHQDLLDAAIVTTSQDEWINGWMDRLSLTSSFIPPEDQSCYKYLLSLDGTATPQSFEWELFTQSLIFKAKSNKIEWFYQELQPGVHYIPFHPRSIDLIEKILWAQTHDEEARIIAENGYRFAEEHLLDEELFVYLYHLLQGYSRLFF